MTTTLVFVAILFSAVMVHELAHYLNARSVGVPVRAFSVGFGPVLWRRRWRGTEWRLSAIPLGGYVDLPGMAPETDEEGNLRHPRGGMSEKPLAAKLWILIGGVLANFVLGVLLITGAVLLEPGFRTLTTGDEPAVSGTRIAEVVADSPAARLGLRVGDDLERVGGVRNPTPAEAVAAIREADGTLSLAVRRGNETLERQLDWPPTDLAPGEAPILGVHLAPAWIEPVPPLAALSESAAFAVRAVPQMVVGFVRGFGSALTGRPSEDVAGPVGMVGLVSDAARVGLAPVLLLAAIINLSLAVFNLLPIPGLDGGRMLLATVVAIRGRPFEPGQEETFHFIGVMAVLALIVLITVQELQGVLIGG